MLYAQKSSIEMYVYYIHAYLEVIHNIWMTLIQSGGKSIEMEEAVALKELLLGNARKVYPDGWIGQAIYYQNSLNLFSLHT